MSLPLYFLPNVEAASLIKQGRLDRELLAARGLCDVWRDVDQIARLSRVDVVGFFEGGASRTGVVLSARTRRVAAPPEAGYEPAKQTWSPVGDGSQLWIGWARNQPPTFEDLERDTDQEGEWITLGDGRQWRCPPVRSLPQKLWRDDAGEFHSEIVAEHQALWRRAGELWDELALGAALGKLGEGEELPAHLQPIADRPRLKAGEQLDFCVDVLRINYRLDHALAGRLGLIDSTALRHVISASLSLPLVTRFQEDAKKN